MEVIGLNEDSWTPALVVEVLQQYVENVDDIIVIMNTKDGDTETVCSKISLEKFALMSKKLEFRLEELLLEQF